MWMEARHTTAFDILVNPVTQVICIPANVTHYPCAGLMLGQRRRRCPSIRTEQNRTGQNRTEQNRTEQNRVNVLGLSGDHNYIYMYLSSSNDIFRSGKTLKSIGLTSSAAGMCTKCTLPTTKLLNYNIIHPKRIKNEVLMVKESLNLYLHKMLPNSLKT